MRLKLFTLAFNPAMGGFDDRAFQDFVKDKEVLEVRSEFFAHNGLSYWTLLVQYRLLQVATPKDKTPAKEDCRSQLTAADQPLYDSLRNWRAEKAKAEGIPPYVVCTNRQLVELITRRPGNLTGFEQIENFGPARVEKYGSELLKLLALPAESAHVG